MGYAEIGKLIDRMLQDQEIRQLLRKDPKEAAKRCGVELTEGEYDAIKQVDWNITDSELKARISKGM